MDKKKILKQTYIEYRRAFEFIFATMVFGITTMVLSRMDVHSFGVSVYGALTSLFLILAIKELAESHDKRAGLKAHIYSLTKEHGYDVWVFIRGDQHALYNSGVHYYGEERIVASANMDQRGVIYACFTGRHHHCLYAIGLDGQKPKDTGGFLTSEMRYVGRLEAYRIAMKAGQVFRKTGNPSDGKLHSEDIWFL